MEVGNIWEIFVGARRSAAVGAAVRTAAKGGLCGGPKSVGDARKAEQLWRLGVSELREEQLPFGIWVLEV